MGDRPRHRRRRARRDPARRLPGSLSRPRRRRERPDAGARQANRLIPAGTPGTLVASQSMYTPTTLPQKEVVVGAISDPAYLSGRAAATDIFPGHAVHGDRLRRERHGVRRLADHGHASAPSRSRSTASTELARRSCPATRSTSTCRSAGVVKLFRAERQGPHDPDRSRPGWRRQPRSSRSRRRKPPSGCSRPTTRSSDFVLRPVVGAKPTKPSQANASTLLR